MRLFYDNCKKHEWIIKARLIDVWKQIASNMYFSCFIATEINPVGIFLRVLELDCLIELK